MRLLVPRHLPLARRSKRLLVSDFFRHDGCYGCRTDAAAA
jgi:hypothetical protein